MIEPERHILLILAFRSLPFAAYLATTKEIRALTRLVVLAGYLVLLSSAERFGLGASIVSLFAVSAYYLVASCAVPRFAEALRSGFATQLALAASFVAIFLLIPGLITSRTHSTSFLVLGWDLALSSYSFCVDVSKSRTKPSIKECLFFLLINPTVTYSNRGRKIGSPAVDLPGIFRILLGLGIMTINWMVIRNASLVVTNVAIPPTKTLESLVRMLAVLTLDLTFFYASHSGLAHIQIGFMRQLGHWVPERYEYPLLADSPLNFWRRWNTYLNSWLSKYVFMPLVRRLGGGKERFAKLVALLITFAVSGILHDLFFLASKNRLSIKYSLAFILSGLFVITWLALSRWIRALSAQFHWTAGPAVEALVGRLSALAMLTILVVLWSS